MSQYAILDGQQVKPCGVLEWARWNETHDRTVQNTSLGAVRVSTVFLGTNHQWDAGPPLWFETMVFGGSDGNGEQERYTTFKEAVQGHAAMVAKVEAAELKAVQP